MQEEINTTILEKVADALTTAGSVFKAIGLDGQDVANDLLEKLSAAQQDMDQMAEVFRSLQNVMNGASSLLAASAITISDAQSTMNRRRRPLRAGGYAQRRGLDPCRGYRP